MSDNLVNQTLIYAQIFQNLAAGLAIIAAAWWFFTRRENVRKANVTHEVVFAEAGRRVYVGVRVTIKNTGRRRIESTVAEPKVVVSADQSGAVNNVGNIVVIEELSPYIGQQAVTWQQLSPEFNLLFLGLHSLPGKIVIEPDEEQTILLDFVIPKTTKAIKVYSHIDNAFNGSDGWNTATIHHVNLPQPQGAKL